MSKQSINLQNLGRKNLFFSAKLGFSHKSQGCECVFKYSLTLCQCVNNVEVVLNKVLAMFLAIFFMLWFVVKSVKISRILRGSPFWISQLQGLCIARTHFTMLSICGKDLDFMLFFPSICYSLLWTWSFHFISTSNGGNCLVNIGGITCWYLLKNIPWCAESPFLIHNVFLKFSCDVFENCILGGCLDFCFVQIL